LRYSFVTGTLDIVNIDATAPAAAETQWGHGIGHARSCCRMQA
jgi:hypothetical protein